MNKKQNPKTKYKKQGITQNNKKIEQTKTKNITITKNTTNKKEYKYYTKIKLPPKLLIMHKKTKEYQDNKKHPIK